jgi:FkbM family methyltransferase
MRLCNYVQLLALYLDCVLIYEKMREYVRFPAALLRLTGGLEKSSNYINRAVINSYRDEVRGTTKKFFTHGFSIILNPKDQTISPWIGVMGRYDLLETALMQKILKEGDVVIDIGANIGWFTLLAARTVARTGKVFSFEPESLNFSLLKASINSNDYINVLPVKKVVSDQNGSQYLYLSKELNPGAHSISENFGGGKELVDSIRLDTFMQLNNLEDVQLLKIDVQGAEPNVLSAAKKPMQEMKIETMLIEWNPTAWGNFQDLLDKILEQYDVYLIWHSPPVLRRIKNPKDLPNISTNLYLRRKIRSR